jgi:4-diphosphocytidyl-2-C-methyl-D-erythritol kinase
MSITGRQSLRAPAKINLGLRLTGVRDDGYHTLESVFCPIELWDDLEIEIRPGVQRIDLTVDAPDATELPAALSAVTAGADNLVVRAAAAFCKHTGLEAEIRMRLHKRIPAGAGLGGGSSDAAAVLRGLASLIKGDSEERLLPGLEGVALGLGADVPFFLAPRPALISGIGEVIEPLSDIPALDVVVVNPGISLSTAEVYRATDALRIALTQPRAGSTMRAISRLRDETENLAPALGDLLINDLEPAARRLCPPIVRWIDRLIEAGAVGASMSGSGATVFGVFESRERASQAAETLRASEAGKRETSWVRVTRIIT